MPDDVSLVTIPRVYLKDKSLAKSGYHTAYASVSGKLPGPTDLEPVATLTFFLGVAYDVPLTTYRLFADAGIATTDLPVRESVFGMRWREPYTPSP